MSASIVLERTTPLVIYGAGEVGRTFARRASSAGHTVLCLLDKNAASLAQSPVPVIRPQDALPDGVLPHNVVVVVGLADGMEHKKVVELLLSLQYRYIVFLPLGFHMSPSGRYALTDVYNRVLSLQDCIGTEIFDAAQYMKVDFDPTGIVQSEEGDRLTVLVDADLVFSEDYRSWKGDKTKIHSASKYADINIAAYDYFYSLYRYLDGQSPDYELYRAGFTKHMDKMAICVKSRAALFDTFAQELDRGLDFFCRGAADASWSARGYFNLVGGHHRTTFLFYRRQRMLHLRISRADYQQWLHIEALQPVLDFLQQKNVPSLYGPTGHPALSNFPIRREGRLDSVYSALMAWLGPQSFSGETVLSLCEDEGYHARLACRNKAEAVWTLVRTDGQAQLTQLLNRLMWLPQIHLLSQLPTEKDFCSFLIVMDAALGLDEEQKCAFLRRMDALCSATMLWESLNEDFQKDQELIRSCTRFILSQELLHPIVDGRQRTVAVFRKC